MDVDPMYFPERKDMTSSNEQRILFVSDCENAEPKAVCWRGEALMLIRIIKMMLLVLAMMMLLILGLV
jgi:hypothetical protein